MFYDDRCYGYGFSESDGRPEHSRGYGCCSSRAMSYTSGNYPTYNKSLSCSYTPGDAIMETGIHDKEEHEMSFICMYKDKIRIVAASDGFELRDRFGGKFTVLREDQKKVMVDKKKGLILAFCGCLEYDGYRTENLIRNAVDRYQGKGIQTLLLLLQESLQPIENCPDLTNVLIGYYDENHETKMALLEMNHQTEDGSVIRTIKYDLGGFLLTAGVHNEIGQNLTYYPSYNVKPKIIDFSGFF